MRMRLKTNGGVPTSLEVTGEIRDLVQIPGYYVPMNKSQKKSALFPLVPSLVQRILDKFPEIEVEEAVKEWRRTERELRHFQIVKADQGFNNPDLYPFQKWGANFINATRTLPQNNQGIRILEADDPRLGKTVQAIVSTIQHFDDTPVLVVCLKNLINQWAVELEKWGPPGLEIFKMTRTSVKKRLELMAGAKKGQVYITNWETIRNHKLKPGLFTTIIGDEAHVIRNIKTQTYKGIKKFKPKNMLLLTATPLERGPEEYYAYMTLLQPRLYQSRWRWIGWFCNIGHNGFGFDILGPKNEDLLKELLSPVVLRRKAEKIRGIPPKIFEEVNCETSKTFDTLYDKIAKEILIEIGEDYELEIPNALARLTRLRQYSITPELLGFSPVSPKLDVIADLTVKYEGHQILIYGGFLISNKIITEHLHKRGVKAVNYTGDPDELEVFQSGYAQCMVCTPQQGGIGLDLSNAKIIIYADLPLSSTILRQSMERTTKIGIKDPRLIISVIATEIDRVVRNLLDKKLDNISDVDIVRAVVEAHKN